MKTNIIVGYLVACILGVLGHFAFDFFGIAYLKIIFPQNESIFEHLKLIFYPISFYMIIDLLIVRKYNELGFRSYVGGIFLALLFVIAAYYTYSGIIGENFMVVDIAIFFIAIFIAFYYRYKKIALFSGLSSIIIYLIMLGLLTVFTFFPGCINFFVPLP